jgi:AcrR family transcriptional regulator
VSTSTSVLARKRDVVRAGIARVAIELFAAQGFDAVTVEEIARAAGVSSRTFFRYFSSKDDVIWAYVTVLHERVAAAFDGRPVQEGAVEALRQAYGSTSRVPRHRRAQVLQVGRILASSEVLRQASYGRTWAAEASLVARVADRMGVSVRDPRPRVIVAAMDAVATAEWHAWVDEGGTGDPSRRVVTVLGLLDSGLSTIERNPT